MPGERWSRASQLLSMTSQRIRRRWVPSYPTPGINRGKYRYPDGPCNPWRRPSFRPHREMFQAKAPEAFEVLCKHLHATDPRVSVSAATQILDRSLWAAGAVDRCQHQDGPTVRYIVELPEKSATTEEWLEGIRREDAGRALVTGVAAAVDDEPTH